ncbi:MAG: DUF2179 domain-containing protein [Candidatus Eisenbacteria bacterium]|nr:DUF2179 domain-containing protein [Candidatus Eisenbacteria bacterium]
MFTAATIITGIIIFAARVIDVSLGTLRTISTVQGRTRAAFILGFIEISMWLAVITTIVSDVAERPVLGLFYALGFSTGNVVGILLERRLAFGHVLLRIFTVKGELVARVLRKRRYGVTTFEGAGKEGPVTEVLVIMKRRDLPSVISLIGHVAPRAFYVTHAAGEVSRAPTGAMRYPTGWRAVLKRK